jgi:VWFA-related protein
MWRTILLLALIAGTLSPSHAAPQPAERLVRLNVFATTAKGDPITDLRASDIQIREDGQVHPAVFFRFSGVKSAIAPPADGEVVNRPAQVPTVILLDRWNDRSMVAAAAWLDVGAAIEHSESPRRTFIYLLNNHGDVVPIHPLPPPDADLRTLAEPTAAQLRAKLDDAVRKLNGLRDIDVLDPVIKANTTFKALVALGGQMATLPGRKNLIWVTHAFPLTIPIPGGDFIDFTPQIRTITAAASQSQIELYTVEESAQGAGADPGSLNRETLQMFSGLTGARWYPSDYTGSALAGALVDGRAAYRVAYYAPVRPKDKKEHKIRLQSARKDVRLLTYEGYFGEPAQADPDAVERVLFTNECHSPFEASEIGLRAKLSTGPDGKSHVDVHIDPADVMLEQSDGKYHGQIALLFATYSQGTFKDAPAPTPIEINLTQDQLDKAQTDGIQLSLNVQPTSGVDKIRLIVFDRSLFGLGSVTLSAPN